MVRTVLGPGMAAAATSSTNVHITKSAIYTNIYKL